MQVFAPFSDIQKIAMCLDQKRLGKQRVEARDLICIAGKKQPSFMSQKQYKYILRRYGNHPAYKMYENHIRFLLKYLEIICGYWTNHYGFVDNCYNQARSYVFIQTKLYKKDKYP